MDLTPDGPLGERDKDMNTLPTEAVGTTHHAHRLLTRGKTQHKTETNLASVAAEGTWRDPFPAPEHAANTAGSRTWSVRVILSRCS